ncbi:alpha-L-rhamnosidase [Paenibacillus silvisoli]|uniref:alpha-L-rhamnosidase n=1 Tax=Paenibacillus silvisoli TaxID=3110539 RepID=UPI00280395AE|nr:family 78 glycoside hydrolase catalytic domain [Paenibacillus silvisoli]
MKITCMKTNRITNPLGFELGKPRVSYVVSETSAQKQLAARIEVSLDERFEHVIFDSGKDEAISSLAYELSMPLQARTRYYWRVTVWADNGETATSKAAWFETAKLQEPWEAAWITPKLDKDIHPVLQTGFQLSKDAVRARAYVCGLGLYEMVLNGKMVGEEYFAPHFNAYDKWLQYQTYDISDLLRTGDNAIEFLLGNGLYKGRFGFNGGERNIYGDRFALLCEVVIEHSDGTVTTLRSDESWKARKSRIVASGLYDGEVYDAASAVDDESYEVEPIAIGYERLQARRSLPVVIHEVLKPAEVITTHAGETVLDMGQNMVGWIQFRNRAPKGTEIVLQYGELLQEGNFYQENLRTAKAEFRYISDGEGGKVRPHFTFFGFRYVKVSGWPEDLRAEDFEGCVLHSDMERIGSIETNDPLVNRLFLNALWGQKGNFLDVPTDCPQRDERMGWTGDAQVFAGTASFNMDTYAFFAKYGYDLWREQAASEGKVPFVVPDATIHEGGSSAWGDAATIIPWEVYLHSGDVAILEQQFESMKAWVDYIKRIDEGSGAKRLWTEGFHFGDWLALDGPSPSSPIGGTETPYLSSAYYRYSSLLVSKAAKVLGKDELAAYYESLSNEVKAAIQAEYFTPTGRLALDTQTALVVALYMDLAPEKDRIRVADSLRERLKKDHNHLKTGFVGTPYLCKALSETGYPDLAYTLLLNKDYPSWLYAVTMGATTIWERWNSVLPDGKISGTDMNSLNHYAYGSIVEWMYRYAAGLNPVEDKPGFKRVRLAPQSDFRLRYVQASLRSAAGQYESRWELDEDGKLSFRFVIPFDASAAAVLPDAKLEEVYVNGKPLAETGIAATQGDRSVTAELTSGTWEFAYMPEIAYIKRCSSHSALGELMRIGEAKRVLCDVLPQFKELPQDMISNFGTRTIRELSTVSFMKISPEALEELDRALKPIKAIAD